MREVIIAYEERKPGERDPGYIEGGVIHELVRCYECKHYDGIDCKKNGIVNIMDANWFCADGKRRESE